MVWYYCTYMRTVLYTMKRISGSLDVRVIGYKDHWMSESLDIRITGCQSHWISRSLDVRINGYRDDWLSESLHIRSFLLRTSTKWQYSTYYLVLMDTSIRRSLRSIALVSERSSYHCCGVVICPEFTCQQLSLIISFVVVQVEKSFAVLSLNGRPLLQHNGLRLRDVPLLVPEADEHDLAEFFQCYRFILVDPTWWPALPRCPTRRKGRIRWGRYRHSQCWSRGPGQRAWDPAGGGNEVIISL